jgi:hypothetical protein
MIPVHEGCGPTANPPLPRTLHNPGPETELHNDWRHARLRTTTRRDSSRPRVVSNSSKIKRKGGVGRGHHGRTSNENTSKCHFFEVMSEVQKDSEDVSAGIGIF